VAGSIAAVGVFIEGWTVEMIDPTYGAELERTHAYALFLLLIPGLLLLWFNFVAFVNRGSEFQVRPDGSVSVRSGDSWEPPLEHQFSADGPPTIALRQDRCSRVTTARDYAARSAPSSSGGCWRAEGSTSSRRHRAAIASLRAGSSGRASGRLDACSW
jgi:hypothetical protein